MAYLSTREAYNQRLVLVNRGGDAAHFRVNNDSFNLEEGVTLDTNTLPQRYAAGHTRFRSRAA